MTQEDKELLLKDLTARLPYGIHIRCYFKEGDRFGYYDGIVMNNISNDYINDSYPLENSKPYLRPMSSMTEDEDNELNSARMGSYGEDVDWLNAHHFDYHSLIEKGLALEAPEGMYKEDEIMAQEETNKEMIINLIDFVTEYGDKYYGSIAKADALNWLEQKLSNDTKSKDILIEAYEVDKGTTSCGQDYKCKKDYKEGNCWYIKDVIYHCSRDGYLNDQNGVSWSCTPEWFNEYIYTNSEWADKEKNDFVSGQFLQCKLSFDEFKEGEHYWLEYVGDDTYVGRSDNILNQKFHITPRQLYTLFSQQLEEVQGPPQEEKQVSLNYKPPFDENPSDKEIIEALIKHLKEQDGFLTAINSISIKAILTWLEKQKEQIPYIDFVIKPHKGDDNNPYDMSVSEAQEYAINRGFGIPLNDDGEVYVDERHMTQTIGNIIRWADEHPKEQKLWEWSKVEMKLLDSIIDDYEKAAKSFCGYDGKIGLLRAIRDGKYNLPKQEWSEEDEIVYESIQTILLAEARFVEEHKWFDSIKDRIKSAYWDEKDEKMYDRLIDRLQFITLNTRTDTTSSNFTFFDEIDWLKSLKNRGNSPKSNTNSPSWKPSKEQIKILEEIVDYFFANKEKMADMQHHLEDFIQDLKVSNNLIEEN